MHKRVKVCVRVRPSAKTNAAGVTVNEQEQTLSVVTNAATGNGTCFHFDQVLDARVDQAGVFRAAAAEVVESVLSGYNGTVMAYGQTGAGKTFTMSGGKQRFEDRGICARAISVIFQHIQRDSEHTYAVRVSYVEVYNENLYDLLELGDHHVPSGGGTAGPHPTTNNSISNNTVGREDLAIQENDKGQTFIRGLARPLVKTEEDAFDLLFQGETNRTIAEHCLNTASTRSHCIFTIYVERKPSSSALLDAPLEDVVVYSKLNLVDLAGSERMKKTGVSGTMLKEAAHINKSLTFLEQVVVALGDRKRQHIPYRQTTLTNLLKDSLGGNCRTLLMACVWPDASHNDQSLATLKFATRMMRVKTSAIVNVAQSAAAVAKSSAAATSQVLASYTREIEQLKHELAMYDTLNGKSHVDYDVHAITSPARQALYKQQVRQFVADSSAHPLPVANLLQLEQLFLAFRSVCLEQQTQIQELTGRIQQHQHDTSATNTVKRPSSASKMVKQFRSLRASSPPDSAPRNEGPALKLPLVSKIPAAAVLPAPPETPECDDEPRDDARVSLALPPVAPERHPALLDSATVWSDKELFEMFKKLDNPTPESLLDVELAKQNLRQAKAQFATCGLEVNQLKLEIDGLSLKLQERCTTTAVAACGEGDETTAPSNNEGESGSGGQGQQPMSADGSSEHFLLVMQLKDAKKRYRDKFEHFQERKAEVNYLVKIKDQMLAQLTREFETWKLVFVRQQQQVQSM